MSLDFTVLFRLYSDELLKYFNLIALCCINAKMRMQCTFEKFAATSGASSFRLL